VTEEDLQQIASLHGRLLQTSQALDTSSPPPVASEPRTLSLPERGVVSASPAGSLPAPSTSEADLIQKLLCLETKVTTLQEQIAQLALALLKERERSVEQRMTALESRMHQLVGKPMPDAPPPEVGQEPVCAPRGVRQLLPAEQLARSRMPPLIEYSQQGAYVIVSSQEGELHLLPDSAQWFDWLARISSFRFVGPAGRFTACRESKGGRGWIAHRSVHQHCYKRSIGVTDRLTIASREQTAATLLTPAVSL
jgi:hypothetical protein